MYLLPHAARLIAPRALPCTVVAPPCKSTAREHAHVCVCVCACGLRACVRACCVCAQQFRDLVKSALPDGFVAQLSSHIQRFGTGIQVIVDCPELPFCQGGAVHPGSTHPHTHTLIHPRTHPRMHSRTCACARIHTHARTRTHKRTHACVCARVRIRERASLRACMYLFVRACVRACMRACVRACVRGVYLIAVSAGNDEFELGSRLWHCHECSSRPSFQSLLSAKTKTSPGLYECSSLLSYFTVYLPYDAVRHPIRRRPCYIPMAML